MDVAAVIVGAIAIICGSAIGHSGYTEKDWGIFSTGLILWIIGMLFFVVGWSNLSPNDDDQEHKPATYTIPDFDWDQLGICFETPGCSIIIELPEGES